MDNRKLVGSKIKEIRKKLNLTQEFFSEAIDIDTSTLSNIERGLSYPSMSTFLNIIYKFNINPNDFFDYEYLNAAENLDDQMIDIIKTQPYDRKQILYRIIKQFAL